MRRVQQSIALGNYCCLGDGKTMQAVATWREINVAALLRTYPRYAADASATMDGVFMTSLAGADRASLKIIIAHLRQVLGDKDVYWDRHNGKLGHRAATPQAARTPAEGTIEPFAMAPTPGLEPGRGFRPYGF